MELPVKHFHQDFIEVSSEYKWILSNLSTYQKQHASSRKVSPFGFDRWFLRLYLNGATDASQGKICIYLHSENEFKVRVIWEITLSNLKRIFCTKKFSHTFQNKSSWGVEMTERAVLLEDFRKGYDTLIVTWKMTIIKRPSQLTNPINISTKDFLSLLQNEINSDVILVSKDGSEYKAHKAILMCRSEVFFDMFQSNIQENQNNVVKMEDVDNNILQKMLKYIYTGKVDDIATNAQQLLIVADKYDLENLKMMCIQYLAENIRNDNILKLMEFAHNYEIHDLKEISKQYFLKNRKKIVLAAGRESINKLSPNIASNLLYELAVIQEREVPTSQSK